jgi:hypothetical protein
MNYPTVQRDLNLLSEPSFMPICCPKCQQIDQTRKLTEIHAAHERLGVFSPVSAPPMPREPGLTQATGVLLIASAVIWLVVSLAGWMPSPVQYQLANFGLVVTFGLTGFWLWRSGSKMRSRYHAQLDAWNLKWYCYRCALEFIPKPQQVFRNVA